MAKFEIARLENVPRVMREEPRWVLWRSEDGVKVPYQPRLTGATVKAKSNDSTTWGTLGDCVKYIQRYRSGIGAWGVGFMLGDGWVGLDFDHVLDEDRNIVNDVCSDIMEEIDGIGYAEVSPSGDGLHVIFKDVNPALSDRYLKKKDIGEGQAIELYFDKRYFTVTGDSLDGWDIGHVCEPAVQFIGENHLQKQKVVRKESSRQSVDASMKKLFDGYRRSVMRERIKEGDRDNSLFRIGSGAADRCGRDYGTVYDLLADVNATCVVPPLPLQDIERIARSSCENSEVRHIELKPLDYCEPMHTEDELVEASNEEFFAELIANKHKYDLREFYKEDGFIGEFMRQCKKDTQQDHHELDFAAAISCLATILSTRVTLMGETAPNLLTVALAPSGTGKEYGRKLAKNLLTQSGFERLVGKDKVSSGQGLYAILADRPQALFCLDEFADTLGDNTKASPIMTSIAEALKMSYSANGSTIEPAAKVDKSFNTVIENCAPTYYLTTTPQAWWNSFRLENAADGVLGRIMYFESPKRRLRKREGNFTFLYKSGAQISDRLINIAEQWNSGVSDLQAIMNTQDKIEWGASQEAIDMFHAFRYEVNERSVTNGDHTSPLWDRCFDKICKLALIFSCSRLGAHAEVKEVSASDMLLAIKVVKSQTYLVSHKLTTELADNYLTKLANRIKSHLKSEKKPLTRGGLAAKGIKVPEREFKQAVEILLAEKKIAAVPAQRGNKDAYLAIEFYADWKEENEPN
jgi:hypothetical protein